jgi:methyltransferase-like protein/predicted O-methyltransferase YrrM
MTDMPARNSYDETPYPILCSTQSHPDHLAALARLLGLSPTPVDRCRVLELGCASGGNLIPMAYGLPNSRFIGIDYSAVQIAEGRKAIAALDLQNITLEHLNILEVTEALGEFDYIIAHGVYSWVPLAVRDKLLAVCKQNLAPNGIAYVSYNVYPGWHLLGMIREMMLYHTRRMDDPRTRVSEARSLLNFLAEAAPTAKGNYGVLTDIYAGFLQHHAKFSVPRHDSTMLHDDLEEVNDPVYFYQFAEHAARHGLQYVAEAEFPMVMSGHFPPPVVEGLQQRAKSLIEMEQYMDFVRNRAFRKTLLCHEDIPLNRSLKTERLAEMYVMSLAEPANSTPDLQNAVVEKFESFDGATFSTDHPLAKAALFYLTEISPQSAPFKTLVAEARNLLDDDHRQVQDLAARARDAQVLATSLLQAFTYSMNLVEFHTIAPAFVTTISERPVISPVARYLAQSTRQVPNLRHERVDLDVVSYHLIGFLDGNHDQADLLKILTDLISDGVIELKTEVDQGKLPELIAKQLDSTLFGFANAALLVG